MKKIFCVVLLCILLMLSGCSWAENDNTICLQKIKEIVSILDADNRDKINELFAQNSLDRMDNFADDVASLFEYYEGTSASINKSGGIVVSDKSNYGKVSKIYDMSYTVKTNVAEYSIAMRWCPKDDFDRNNIGIHYIYILNSKYNPYPEEKYWGDGTGTEGIFTNRLHGGTYTDLVMDLVVAGDKHNFKKMFRSDIIVMNNFDEQVEILFDTYECRYDISNYYVRRYETDTENGYEISSFYVKGFDSPEVSYRLCMQWCLQDNNNQSGIVSLYIEKVSGTINMEKPYWADALWTKGINIVVNN